MIDSNSSGIWNNPTTGSAYPLLASLTSVMQRIYFVIDAYLSPIYLIMVTVNNLLCLAVFLFNREFQQRHSTNARYYYMFLALSDICTIYAWDFPSFMGDGLYYASGGHIYWWQTIYLFLFINFIIFSCTSIL